MKHREGQSEMDGKGDLSETWSGSLEQYWITFPARCCVCEAFYDTDRSEAVPDLCGNGWTQVARPGAGRLIVGVFYATLRERTHGLKVGRRFFHASA